MLVLTASYPLQLHAARDESGVAVSNMGTVGTSFPFSQIHGSHTFCTHGMGEGKGREKKAQAGVSCAHGTCMPPHPEQHILDVPRILDVPLIIIYVHLIKGFL